jgi:hypothetical protein
MRTSTAHLGNAPQSGAWGAVGTCNVASTPSGRPASRSGVARGTDEGGLVVHSRSHTRDQAAVGTICSTLDPADWACPQSAAEFCSAVSVGTGVLPLLGLQGLAGITAVGRWAQIGGPPTRQPQRSKVPCSGAPITGSSDSQYEASATACIRRRLGQACPTSGRRGRVLHGRPRDVADQTCLDR